MSPLAEKMRALAVRQSVALHKLVEPARAAANAMKDAGMHRSADPILEVLFQLDALQEEMVNLVRADPAAAINVIFHPEP